MILYTIHNNKLSPANLSKTRPIRKLIDYVRSGRKEEGRDSVQDSRL